MSLTLRYLCLGYANPKELLDSNIIDALQALYKIDTQETTSISEDVVEVTRSICTAKGCESALATGQMVVMLKRAAEMCRSDKKTMYSITVILYRSNSIHIFFYTRILLLYYITKPDIIICSSFLPAITVTVLLSF